MTSPLAKPTGSSNPNPAHRAQAAAGQFMLTLCALAAPVSIRPPRSAALKPFTFFMGRARQPDGSERLYLHMGYFKTLAEAERWLGPVRRHYPNAFATVKPVEYLRPADAQAAWLPTAASQPAALQSSDPVRLKAESLSDTQVLKILEARGASGVQDDSDERACDQIALLRPEDTGTRRALKEAVIQGAPVSFAVQLYWSAQPIDLSGVPSLAIFKSHTLYATERHREGRSCHFLRLGFFADPISAKQVAVQVCHTFGAAAVVPVLEPEVTRAREAGIGSSAIPNLGEQRVDLRIDFNATSGASTPSNPLSGALRRVSGGAEAVGPTHKPLAKRGAGTHADPLSESGVRHLRVEVQEHLSGRWKIVRLGATGSNMVQVDS
jgi:hypothetical protein